MDPLVFMDYADDMNPAVMFIGFGIFFAAFAVQVQSVSNLLQVEFSIVDSLIYMVYGISTIIGGFLQGEAEYLEYFVNISAGFGFLMVSGGSLMTSLISEGLWFKVSVIALFFLSIPSTLAAWYTRESVYEDGKYGPRNRFD